MRASLVLVLAAAAAGADDAAPEPRHALVVSGLFGLAQTFDESRTITLFAEKGTIDTTYRAGLGPGAEIGVVWPLGGRLGIQATAGASRRSGRGTYAARLPHPLYLDAHRRSEGTVDGLSYLEIAGHVGLAWSGRAGTLAYTLFAGPSVYRVEAELIERAETLESYPYDEVTFTLPIVTASRVAPGAHAGVIVHYPVAPRLSLGVQTRYGYGRVRLSPNDEDETDVQGGGPQISLGLRWAF